jgi:prepilin signal peptidase PulO-like enzyme (type II secretory pathway)
MLRGKCRYCGKKIDDNPLVEVLLPIFFIISYVYWPYGFDTSGWVLFGLWLVFLVGFMALAAYDLRWMILPNRIVYFLIGLAIIQVAFKMLAYDAADELMEAFWGFVAIGGFFYALFQVSGGKWIGGGDVKLGFLIGPLVGGPLNAILVLFVASVLGSLVSLPLMAKKKLSPSSRIPFGPFLLAATFVVYIFGEYIAGWYERIFLSI